MTLTVDRTCPRHYGDEQGRYFSVSQVCQVLTGGNEWTDPAAMQRGTDLHQIFALAIAAYAWGSAMPDVPEEYGGYYRAIQSWIAQMHPVPSVIERADKHRTLPYAGTPDFVGTIKGQYGVLDLKTGPPARWHAVQLHAYKGLLHEQAVRMWLLYIRDDGISTMKRVPQNPRDWAAFQNGLSILTWRDS